MKQSLFILALLFSVAVSARREPVMHIGQRTIRFADSSRSNRPLVTEIWYPTADSFQAADRHPTPFLRDYTVRDGRLPSTRLPLIMLSHGTGGGRLTLEWLAQALVKKGFVVAAVDHFGNTYDNKIPLMFFEFWQRPLDIRYVLTRLLAEKELGSILDSSRIGAAGFSIGGYTVIGLAGGEVDVPAMMRYYKTIGHREIEFPELPGLSKMLDDSTLNADVEHIPDLKDDRIKAVLSINPGLGSGFIRPKQVKRISSPVFIIGCQSDSMAPAIPNARHLHKLIPASEYYEFPGNTGHYVMLNEAIDELKKAEPGAFSDAPGVDRHQVHLAVDSLAINFFRRTLF